jgi:hypothetical protein
MRTLRTAEEIRAKARERAARWRAKHKWVHRERVAAVYGRSKAQLRTNNVSEEELTYERIDENGNPVGVATGVAEAPYRGVGAMRGDEYSEKAVTGSEYQTEGVTERSGSSRGRPDAADRRGLREQAAEPGMTANEVRTYGKLAELMARQARKEEVRPDGGRRTGVRVELEGV